MDVAYGIELRSANSLVAPQRALLYRYTFQGALVLGYYKGNEIISAQSGEDVNYSRTVSEAFEKIIHSFGTFNFNHNDRPCKV